MSKVLAELIDILALEQIEQHIFRGQSQDLGWGRVFGGQVLGQSLSAAQQTVPSDRLVHSLHAYFLRPGDASLPIVYTVDPIRDGRSFTTRRVVAVQKGKPIFHMSASFQIEEGGLDHQQSDPPSGLPDPLDVPPNEARVKAFFDKLPGPMLERIPAHVRERALSSGPIDVRVVDAQDYALPSPSPAVNRVFFKTNGPVGDDPLLHRFLLAYASDMELLGTSLRPHGVSWLTPGMQVASIDHAMYFHHPFRFDDWLLYDMDAPIAAGGRGLAHGRIYDGEGRLVATTIQEGLIRDRRR